MNIGRAAGLPIHLEGLRLGFDGGLEAVTPQARTLDELRPVLYNQTAVGPDAVYLMYRGVGWPEDRERAARRGLRFDLTVVTGELLGGEYARTFGHYHPPMPGSDRTYPELYQVIHGTAHCLLQRLRPDGEAAEVVVVMAGPGELVLIPPGYGHLTINPGPGPLVMANWVAAGFRSDYEAVRSRRGFAYYEVEHDGRGYFVPNDHYTALPPPRIGAVLPPGRLMLQPGDPVYRCQADRLAFLVDPAAELPVDGD